MFAGDEVDRLSRCKSKALIYAPFPRGEWNIKFNFAAVQAAATALRLDTVNRASGIHYFLHNMRKQHLNETFVWCQMAVVSRLSVQEQEAACWIAVAEQSVSPPSLLVIAHYCFVMTWKKCHGAK